MREDLIQSAVSFLTDPKVQSATLAKKVSFLESKGMTSEEIEEAMSRANGNTPSSAAIVPAAAPTAVPGAALPGAVVPYNAAAPPVPARPKYDWRDVFIAAVLAGGATYGLWTFAKRLFGPWFKVPSKEQLERDKAALDAQFQAVEESLKEINDQTNEALTAVSNQSDKVNKSIVSLEAALEDLKKGDDTRQTEFGKVRDEVDSLKEMVPQLIDRNKQEQNLILEDLQTELKSLKNLLLSRRPSTPVASEPTSANSIAITAATPAVATPAAALESGLSSKLAAALNSNSSSRGIPAWQMAADSGNKAVTASPSSEQQQSTTTAESSSSPSPGAS